MITLNLKLRGSELFGSYTCQGYGTKRGFTMCKSEVNGFFNIPNSASDIKMLFTKTPVDGSYAIAIKRVKIQTMFGGNNYYETKTTLDGFNAGLYGSQLAAAKRLLKDGYNNVRVTYA